MCAEEVSVTSLPVESCEETSGGDSDVNMWEVTEVSHLKSHRVCVCVCGAFRCSGSVSIRSLWPPSCALWVQVKVWTSLRTWSLQRVFTSRWGVTPHNTWSTSTCTPLHLPDSCSYFTNYVLYVKLQAWLWSCDCDIIIMSSGEVFEGSRWVRDRWRDGDPAEEEQSGETGSCCFFFCCQKADLITHATDGM